MYPDIPKFEIAHIPDGTETIDLTEDPLGAANNSVYTCPTVGVTCVTDMLADAAAQFESDIPGLSWAWSVDWASQRAVLSWTGGNGVTLTLTNALNTYIGQADVVNQPTDLTAAAAPDGIWYPTSPLVRDYPESITVNQYCWIVADAASSVAGAESTIRHELTTRVDNTADDWAEYQQLYDFVINHAADGDYFSWFTDYGDAHTAAALVAMDERQTDLRFRRIAPGTRRYFDCDLMVTRLYTGLL